MQLNKGGNGLLCNKTFLQKFQKEILQVILHNDRKQVILIWDAFNEALLATQSFERYFDLPLTEVINQDVSLILPEQLWEQITTHFSQTSEKMETSQRFVSPSNQEFTHFAITIDRVQLDSEDPIYICTMKDRTEMKAVNQQLYNLEKAMLTAQMSANVVHEIRNPLTSMKGFLQLLEAGIEHREQYTQVLLSELDKIENLTNELLQMANPHKNDIKSVSLNELFSDVLLLVKAQARMKNITIDLNGDLNVMIKCNPTEIKQAFINLIINGAEAMNCHGLIKINVHRQNNDIVIEIIDHGHGMSRQGVKEINKEFYTTKEHGTGLGLVVTKQIIENHRGSLSVFSVENIGSTFEIVLPLNME